MRSLVEKDTLCRRSTFSIVDEVVLVDENNSGDQTVEVARQLGDFSYVIRHDVSTRGTGAIRRPHVAKALELERRYRGHAPSDPSANIRPFLSSQLAASLSPIMSIPGRI